MAAADAVPIESVDVSVYVVPTDAPESDGTIEWDRTTVVVIEIAAGGAVGLGWTYANRATAEFVRERFIEVLRGANALDIPRVHALLVACLRNDGRPGVAATALSGVDAALWDLKAKLFGRSLVDLLGARRPCAPVYGSGGFTSYSDARLAEQLGGWAREGIPRVKMKVGREPGRDVERVRVARGAIGDAQLFVDGNGAYGRKQALELAGAFHDLGVVWFEEPVSSDDLEGLRRIRDRAPPGMDVAAGEYGYDLVYFRRMLEAGAVDVLQADATRCSMSVFLQVDALCAAFSTPLSAHCAPTLHAPLACAAQRLEHIEYFHDHVRIEHILFDGAAIAKGGAIWPDRSRPGLGVSLKRADAARYRV